MLKQTCFFRYVFAHKLRRFLKVKIEFFSYSSIVTTLISLNFQGELTITSDMEVLENSLFLDQVPPIWTARAYPSLNGLTAWFVDLLMRLRELETWSTDFVVIFFIVKWSVMA